MKRVYFVRHGETDANLNGYYQSPEVPLSEKGHQGAKAVAQRCTHLNVDVVFASPFVRAQETAQHIVEAIKKPLITCEYAHEVLNAKFVWGIQFTSKEAITYQAERTENYTNPEWSPDGAENYFMVSERVTKTLEMIETSEHDNILLVAHGNFLKQLVARLLLQKREDVESNMAIYRSLDRMASVGITEFTYEDGQWKLFTWNDYAHFAE